MTYGIEDAHGTAIGRGMQSWAKACEAAQAAADRTRQVWYVFEEDGDQTWEFSPAAAAADSD